MPALTENTQRNTSGGEIYYPTASNDTYFSGAFITAGSNGLAKPAGGPTEEILGVYVGFERTVASDDSDKRIPVMRPDYLDYESATIADTQSNLGKLVKVDNDNDISVRTNNTDKVLGRIVQLNSDTNIVRIDTKDRG